jgi:ubiquinone/menaquinone biosynthesis C-methylase UbiE
MRSLFDHAHKGGVAAIRDAVSDLIPRDAKVIYDFGASTGEQATSMLRNLGPDARCYCVEPSPYGHIVGKHLQDDPRIDWVYDMVEDMDLKENSADVVQIMFVLHECPDFAKTRMIRQAFKVLKPGGQLIITEPPLDDLVDRARGFFEPYREQWAVWDGQSVLKDVGFQRIEDVGLVDPFHMFTLVARK